MSQSIRFKDFINKNEQLELFKDKGFFSQYFRVYHFIFKKQSQNEAPFEILFSISFSIFKSLSSLDESSFKN